MESHRTAVYADEETKAAVSDRLAAFSLRVKRLEEQFHRQKKERMSLEQNILSKSNRIDQIIAENERLQEDLLVAQVKEQEQREAKEEENSKIDYLSRRAMKFRHKKSAIDLKQKMAQERRMIEAQAKRAHREQVRLVLEEKMKDAKMNVDIIKAASSNVSQRNSLEVHSKLEKSKKQLDAYLKMPLQISPRPYTQSDKRQRSVLLKSAYPIQIPKRPTTSKPIDSQGSFLGHRNFRRTSSRVSASNSVASSGSRRRAARRRSIMTIQEQKDFMHGDYVWCNWQGYNDWYAAIIVDKNIDGKFYEVMYDDGDTDVGVPYIWLRKREKDKDDHKDGHEALVDKKSKIMAYQHGHMHDHTIKGSRHTKHASFFLSSSDLPELYHHGGYSSKAGNGNFDKKLAKKLGLKDVADIELFEKYLEEKRRRSCADMVPGAAEEKILKKKAEIDAFVDFCNNAMSHTNFGQDFREKWDSRRANELKAAQKMGLLTPDEIQAYSSLLREESVVEEKKKDFLEQFLDQNPNGQSPRFWKTPKVYNEAPVETLNTMESLNSVVLEINSSIISSDDKKSSRNTTNKQQFQKNLLHALQDMDDEMYSTKKSSMTDAQKMQDLRRRTMWVKANSSDPGRPYETPKYIHPFPDLVQHLKETSPKIFEKIRDEKSWEGHENLRAKAKQSMNRSSNKLNPRNRFRRSKIKVKNGGLQILTQNDHGRPFVPGGAPNYSPKSPKGHIFDTQGRPPVTPRTIKDPCMPWCTANMYH